MRPFGGAPARKESSTTTSGKGVENSEITNNAPYGRAAPQMRLRVKICGFSSGYILIALPVLALSPRAQHQSAATSGSLHMLNIRKCS